jgi:hypothetical protein
MTRPTKIPLAIITIALTLAGIIWAGGTTIAGKAGLGELQSVDRRVQKLETSLDFIQGDLKEVLTILREQRRDRAHSR